MIENKILELLSTGSGYHSKDIPKGKYGTFSKITEEYLEALDAHSDSNIVMTIVELSDLIGAIAAYIQDYNLTIFNLIEMAKATERAFDAGKR